MYSKTKEEVKRELFKIVKDSVQKQIVDNIFSSIEIELEHLITSEMEENITNAWAEGYRHGADEHGCTKKCKLCY